MPVRVAEFVAGALRHLRDDLVDGGLVARDVEREGALAVRRQPAHPDATRGADRGVEAIFDVAQRGELGVGGQPGRPRRHQRRAYLGRGRP